MKESEYCQKLCEREMSSDDVNNFVWMIERRYKINW